MHRRFLYLIGSVLALIAVGPSGAAAAVAPLPPQFASAWGSPGIGDSQFNDSFGVAVAAGGDVYVTDFTFEDSARVEQFTGEGAFVRTWGTEGTGPGQFNQPYGVAINRSTGAVYVTDFSGRVQQFTLSGGFIRSWTIPGGGVPAGIAVSPITGDVYVTDIDFGVVRRYTAEGSFVGQWGSQGTALGQLRNPFGLAVSPISGDVYVADPGNHRVQEFTSSGTFVRSWGGFGGGNGQMREPRGVAVAADGTVFVVDTGNNRLQEFTSTGTFVTKWGSPGNDEGQFDHPRSMAVSDDGRVYVADNGNFRIQVFEPPHPSLDVDLTRDQSVVAVGAEIDYQLQVTNTGNARLTGVRISAPRATDCAGAVADIAPGASRTVDCGYRTTTDDLGSYRNVARVSTDQTERVSSNSVETSVVFGADAQIATAASGPYLGDNIFSPTLTPEQTRKLSVQRGATSTFHVKLSNDGPTIDDLRIRAVESGSPGYMVTYLRGTTNVSVQVTDSDGLTVEDVPANGVIALKVKVTATTASAARSSRSVDVWVSTSNGPRSARDQIRAKVTRL